MQFKSEFFSKNRERLSKKVPNGLIVIAANSTLQSSADVTFPFRQDSNFWYLTGIDEPDMVLVMNTITSQATLVLPELNDYQEEWDGQQDQKELKKISGIDTFCAGSDFSRLLQKGKQAGLEIYYLQPLPEVVEPFGFYSNPARAKLEKQILKVEKKPKDVRPQLGELRHIKQPIEIQAIQAAIDVTAEALKSAKSNLKQFKTEKELERHITACMYTHGSDGHGYHPIVAAGKNAAILHYNRSVGSLSSKGHVLLDVGAQTGYYSADISRTWSLGQPSARFKELHEGVLRIQDKAFLLLKPGLKLRNYQKELETYTQKIMKQLGCSNADQPFPHGFSHHLGLDVHDAADYHAPLQENMVITVEPGIYLADEGIGIRIEDNVRITKTGIEILSSKIPREL